MSLDLQNRYSKAVDAKLRFNLVQKDGVIWNNRFEGDPKAKAVQVPVRDTEVTTAAYNKESGVAATHASGTFATLVIDKDYAVNEIIDGYEADAVPDNLVADRLDSAAYSLALQVNADATTELLKGTGVAGDTTALTKDTIYASFVDTAKKMNEAKIPMVDRFALVTPATLALLQTAPEFIKASALGDAVVQSGAVGNVAGFNVYMDATLVGKQHKSNTVEYICGHKDWCARVREWQKPIHLQNLDGSGKYIGASAVQGRYIYGHLLTKKETVFIKAAAGK